MAKLRIVLSELIEKGGDVDFVREMLQYAVRRLALRRAQPPS